MRTGQARRRDANEKAVVEALRSIGVQVLRVSEPGCPDLLVWTPQDGFRLLEVKQPTGRLTVLQQRASVPFTVVRSVAQALALFGCKS